MLLETEVSGDPCVLGVLCVSEAGAQGSVGRLAVPRVPVHSSQQPLLQGGLCGGRESPVHAEVITPTHPTSPRAAEKCCVNGDLHCLSRSAMYRGSERLTLGED